MVWSSFNVWCDARVHILSDTHISVSNIGQILVTRLELKDIFWPIITSVFLDMKDLFSESIRTLSKLKRTKPLSHLELLFVLCEVRQWSIYYDPTRSESDSDTDWIFFWFRFFSCFFPYCTSSYVNKLLPVLASRCELFLLINSSSSLSTWLQTLSVFSFTQHRIAAFMEFRWIYFSIPKQTLQKNMLE
jgi:hypothetical protein